MGENWRAGLAYVDRVDRGRFSAGARSTAEEPKRGEDRLDLSELSAEELEVLERRYTLPGPSDAGGDVDR